MRTETEITRDERAAVLALQIAAGRQDLTPDQVVEAAKKFRHFLTV